MIPNGLKHQHIHCRAAGRSQRTASFASYSTATVTQLILSNSESDQATKFLSFACSFNHSVSPEAICNPISSFLGEQSRMYLACRMFTLAVQHPYD